DGSCPLALSHTARGYARVTPGGSRGRVGPARRHRHARDRQFHRSFAPLHRGRPNQATAPADHSRRRVPFRGPSHVAFHLTARLPIDAADGRAVQRTELVKQTDQSATRQRHAYPPFRWTTEARCGCTALATGEYGPERRRRD